MQLGNGRWETASYNSRQQITQIGLGTTDSTQDLLKLEYRYGNWSGSTLDETKNNGSMAEQKITVPTVGANTGFAATQTYTYDELNRIHDAVENVTPTGGSSSQSWKQTFSYDRYGNRNFDTSSSGLTTTLGSCSTAECNPTISTGTNRISSSGYTFDANGNMTANAAGERFGYDAENHQKEFFNSSNSGSTPDATYSYDGDGRRIKKVSSTETTIFVYDGGGQMIAEYSTALATTPQVSYLTQDHLGSPRVVTNENGAVTSRKDYAAFGEETSTSQRVSGLGYVGSADELRKGYTGYEKDSESGLDYAQARYYNPQHGRYTSIDPMTASATIRNPQTFNRYSYVLNSPYKFTDPLGLIPSGSAATEPTDCTKWCIINGEWIRGSDLIREATPADVGIAGPHEELHSGQEQAAQTDPPPNIDPDRNSTLGEINNMNSTQIAALEMILGEMISTSQVGQNEYLPSQNTSGSKIPAPAPTGEAITTSAIQTSMFMFLLAMENRAAAGGFGGNKVEDVMSEGQVARSRGRGILQAFIDNKKRGDGLGGLNDVELSVSAVSRWSQGGVDNGVNNVRADLQMKRIDDTKILYWKAVIQPPGNSLRPWRQGKDVVRVGRTDFGYEN